MREVVGAVKFCCPHCEHELRWEVHSSHNTKIFIRLIMYCELCGVEIALPVANRMKVVGIITADSGSSIKPN